MNIKISSALLIAVLVIFPVLTAGTVSGGEIKSNSSKPDSKIIFFEGTLAVKEGHDGDIFVRSDNNLNKRRLKVSKNTTISRNGKPASYDDLKVGDKVRLQHNSQHVVVELQATGS